MKRCELLAPAGTLEKLKIAIAYGADAVYFGGKDFSLRAKAGNLTQEEIVEGIEYAKRHGVKSYVTLNIFARNDDLKSIKEFLFFLSEIGPDGVIISDPGVINICKKYTPNIPIHLSTQANTLNYESVNFWADQGIKRINLARELSFKEIKAIRKKARNVELEVFVHGALCIAYSGRCMLSLYLAGREANRGSCAHPCRYSYSVVEEKRPGQFFPVEEDERGLYIFNTKDLSLIRRLRELVDIGVDSFKIEGRMKGMLYIASVVRAYRFALDAAYKRKDIDLDKIMDELLNISSRGYTENFFSNIPDVKDMNYEDKEVPQPYIPVAIVKEVGNEAIFKANYCIRIGDELEYMDRDLNDKRFRVTSIISAKDELPLEKTVGGELIKMKVSPNIDFMPYGLIRRKNPHAC